MLRFKAMLCIILRGGRSMHNDKKEGLRYKLGVCSVSFRQSSPESIF